MIYLGLDHLLFAAFLAIAFLSDAVSLLALAFPPFNPPLRPMLARYSLTDWDCQGSSSDGRTISAADWFGSLGSGLLERLMRGVWRRRLRGSRGCRGQSESLPKTLGTPFMLRRADLLDFQVWFGRTLLRATERPWCRVGCCGAWRALRAAASGSA